MQWKDQKIKISKDKSGCNEIAGIINFLCDTQCVWMITDMRWKIMKRYHIMKVASVYKKSKYKVYGFSEYWKIMER